MTPSDKFRIEQIAPDLSLSWALTEWFHWNQQVNDVLKRDVDETLLKAAYDAVDWEKYYERLRGTPFYNWAVEGGGILTFGGPYHVQHNCFFSHIGDTSTVEGDWLREHPEFNQVLHDIHVETAGQMIDSILGHAPKKKRRKRRRKRSKARPGGAALRVGDSVVNDLYGIIVRVAHRRRLVAFPLCDLEVTDERSPNYQLVEDYGVWFSNR